MSSSPPESPTQVELPKSQEKKRGLHRRLYDWMISFAYTKYAIPALFVFAFAESSFFPIPPDVLLIMIVLGKPKSAKTAAIACCIGSVIGGLAGYGIGHFFWSIQGVQDFFFHYVPGFTEANFTKVQGLYEEWAALIVFIAGFTPLPYKVITITAGVAGINLPIFLVASAVSRSARFVIVAWLVARFGPRAKDFIERRFNLLSIAFVVLLVGGFVAVKYALPHDQGGGAQDTQKQGQPATPDDK